MEKLIKCAGKAGQGLLSALLRPLLLEMHQLLFCRLSTNFYAPRIRPNSKSILNVTSDSFRKHLNPPHLNDPKNLYDLNLNKITICSSEIPDLTDLYWNRFEEERTEQNHATIVFWRWLSGKKMSQQLLWITIIWYQSNSK